MVGRASDALLSTGNQFVDSLKKGKMLVGQFHDRMVVEYLLLQV